jgi:hypothetical protein
MPAHNSEARRKEGPVHVRFGCPWDGKSSEAETQRVISTYAGPAAYIALAPGPGGESRYTTQLRHNMVRQHRCACYVLVCEFWVLRSVQPRHHIAQ